jgi:cytochrome P450
MAADAGGNREFNIVDPKDYAAYGYPHDIFTRLRAEDPVHWWDRTEGPPFWAVTKHADITELSKIPEKFVSGVRLTISHEPEVDLDTFPPTLIQLDPPKHGITRESLAPSTASRFRICPSWTDSTSPPTTPQPHPQPL